MSHLTTREVAKAIGAPLWELGEILRCGRLRPPHKNGSGDFVWYAADLDRARKALAEHRADRAARQARHKAREASRRAVANA
jgi:hypothetical protein